MRTFRATVLGKATLSVHLVRVTLGGEGLSDYESTGIPDEYTRLLIPPAGAELALPDIGPDWTITYPEGAAESDMRVYTISDYRIIDGARELDIDIALHDVGSGSTWATNVQPGDEVGLIKPHGLYAAPAGVGWQLLVTDITGVPAVSRILRGLEPEQRVEVTVVLTDSRDQIFLPTLADATINWVVVDDDSWVGNALVDAVAMAELPDSDRYVWVAGVAHANRAARKYLRRELGWPQTDFSTCGYWQFDAEKWNRRYEAQQVEILAKVKTAREAAGDDLGGYFDTLEEIYEAAGL